MRSKHFLIADTETVGLPPNNFVYDFGYTIATRKDIVLERSFLVREIVTDAKKMMGAYFAAKVFSFYIPALDENRIQIFDWLQVVEILREDMATHKVEVFCAYNLNFDMRALTATNYLINSGGKVLDYRPALLDLWTYACGGALNSRLYHDMAIQQNDPTLHDWISEAGNVRTTAEKAYAFLTGQIDFIESHTGLEDAIIETEILQRLLAKKKMIPYDRIASMPWRNAQTIEGTLLDKINSIEKLR
jgi:hypothetical protein